MFCTCLLYMFGSRNSLFRKIWVFDPQLLVFKHPFLKIEYKFLEIRVIKNVNLNLKKKKEEHQKKNEN